MRPRRMSSPRTCWRTSAGFLDLYDPYYIYLKALYTWGHSLLLYVWNLYYTPIHQITVMAKRAFLCVEHVFTTALPRCAL